MNCSLQLKSNWHSSVPDFGYEIPREFTTIVLTLAVESRVTLWFPLSSGGTNAFDYVFLSWQSSYQTFVYGNLILSTASAAVLGVNVRIILQIPLTHVMLCRMEGWGCESLITTNVHAWRVLGLKVWVIFTDFVLTDVRIHSIHLWTRPHKTWMLPAL